MLNNTLNDNTHSQKILIEQVTMLYQSMTSLLVINLVVSMTLVESRSKQHQ
jgi:hypothetical protein